MCGVKALRGARTSPCFATHGRRAKCRWTPQPRMPSHPGLSGKKAESAVSLDEESVANFGRGCRGVIPVRGGTENVAAFRQWLSALFRNMSRWRCFSSQ
jgi:hypothetical protein